MHEATIVLGPHRNMRVDLASSVVAREDGVEIRGAPVARRLPSPQPTRIGSAIHAQRIRLPDVHARPLERLAALHVDDLQRETHVDALLADGNVLALELALVVVRAGDILGRGDADEGRGGRLVVPAELEEVLVVKGLVVEGLLVLLVRDGVPLCEGGGVGFVGWGVSMLRGS
jgi:hypothetical protein